MTANPVATWTHHLGGGRYLEMAAYAERAADCPVCGDEAIYVRRSGLYIHDRDGVSRCCHWGAVDWHREPLTAPPALKNRRPRGRGRPNAPAASQAA